MWDLWWPKWHWDRLFSDSFGFSADIIPPLLCIHSYIIWGTGEGPVRSPSSTDTLSHLIEIIRR
jgi:hypothetical protein